MSALSRRSLVTSAAALPALALPAIAAATAVEALPVVKETPETSFPDLVKRFVRVRERWLEQRATDEAHSKIIDEAFHRETGTTMAEFRSMDCHSPRWKELTDVLHRVYEENPDEHDPHDEAGSSIPWDEILDELWPLMRAMLERSPQSVVDLAWQAEALRITDASIQNEDDCNHVRKLITNIRELAFAGLPEAPPWSDNDADEEET